MDQTALDGLGEFVDSDRTVMLGIVPSTAPTQPPSVDQLIERAVTLTDRIGFPRRFLAERVGVTPACGLAGATSEWARIAIELAQKTVDALSADPEVISGRRAP